MFNRISVGLTITYNFIIIKKTKNNCELFIYLSLLKTRLFLLDR